LIAVQHKNKFLFPLFVVVFLFCTALALISEQYLLAAVPFVLIFLSWSWQNPYPVFFLLLSALPFSFEYSFSPSLGTDLPDEPLMLLVSGLFLAYWICHPEIVNRKKLSHPLLLILFITVLWSACTAIFSTYPALSVKYLLAKTWYIGAFVLAPLIIFREKKQIKNAALMLAGGLVFVSAIALVRHYRFGFRFANINDALYPFFRNHVNYSAMLVCSVPLLLAFYTGTKKTTGKNIVIALLVVVLAAMFFSYSRGAWLAFVAGLASYWLIRNKLLVAAYITIVLVVTASLFWLRQNDNYLKYANDFKTTIFHENFSEHLIATYKLKDVSTAERFYRWVAGVRMIKDNAITGYGPNTFYNNYKAYTVPAFKTWVSDNDDHSTVHNYFLLTAIEQGLPGLIFLLVLFGAILYYAQKIYHRAKNLFYKTAAMTCGVITVMIMVVNFLSDLVETDKIGSFFFMCIAALVTADINTRHEKESNFSSHIQGIS
jgi:O-antigen ligase